MIVYDEKVPRSFCRSAIVTAVLPSRDSKIRGAIVRIAKANAILKHPVNKLFPTEYTNHDTNQTDKTRKQKLKWEAAAIGELKRKYVNCVKIGRGRSLWTLQVLIFWLDLISHEKYFPVLPEF